MITYSALVEKVPLIEERISYRFKNRELLLTAFVHRSFFNENRSLVQSHNERLEFLGDSVLGLIVSDFLFKNFPNFPEGELSRFRAQFVDASTCSKLLHKLALDGFILLGKGERMNAGRGRTTIIADLFEALFGAIYLDGGIEAARAFFHHHFEGDLLDSIRAPARNWKAELQDYAQKRYQKPPTYVVVKEFGPDHNKMFEVAVFLNDQEMGRGFGNSKKTAEQGAAEEAWKKLE